MLSLRWLLLCPLIGGRVKTWKRRWFILTDNCLYYFEYTTVSKATQYKHNNRGAESEKRNIKEISVVQWFLVFRLSIVHIVLVFQLIYNSVNGFGQQYISWHYLVYFYSSGMGKCLNLVNLWLQWFRPGTLHNGHYSFIWINSFQVKMIKIYIFIQKVLFNGQIYGFWNCVKWIYYLNLSWFNCWFNYVEP